MAVSNRLRNRVKDKTEEKKTSTVQKPQNTKTQPTALNKAISKSTGAAASRKAAASSSNKRNGRTVKEGSRKKVESKPQVQRLSKAKKAGETDRARYNHFQNMTARRAARVNAYTKGRNSPHMLEQIGQDAVNSDKGWGLDKTQPVEVKALLRSANLDPLSAMEADAHTWALDPLYRSSAVKNKKKSPEETGKAILEDFGKRHHDRVVNKQRLAGADVYKLSKEEQRVVKEAKTQFDIAKKRGHQEGMKNAHAKAETYRNRAGYSGGEDGSEYITPELSREDWNALNKEGRAKLAEAKLHYDSAQTQEEREKWTAQGKKIRGNPLYRKDGGVGLIRSKTAGKVGDSFIPQVPKAATTEDAHGRSRWAGNAEDAQREADRLKAIPKAIGYDIAGAFVSLPEVTQKAIRQRAYQDRARLQAISDMRGGGEVNIPEYQEDPDAKESLGQRLLRQGREQREKATAGLSPFERYLTQGLITIGEMAPGLLATALTGGAAAPGLLTMGAQAAGGKMGELTARGVDPSEAWDRGVLSGVIEAGSEKIPLEKLTKLAKGSGGASFVKSLFQQMGVEIGTEEASAVLNYLADKAAKDPEASLTAQDLLDTAIISGISTAMMTGGAGAIGSARQRRLQRTPLNDALDSRQTQANGQAVTRLQDAATPSVEALAAQEEALQKKIENYKERAVRHLERLQDSAGDPLWHKHLLQELAAYEQEGKQLQNEIIGLNMQKQQRAAVEQQKAEVARRKAEEQARREREAQEVQQETGPIQETSQIEQAVQEHKASQTFGSQENTRLTESDLDDYMKVGVREHVRNAKEDIRATGQSPILTTLIQIRDFMKDALSGGSRDTIKAYGRVGQAMADDIAQKADFNIGDLSGFYLELDANRLDHMTKHMDDDGDPRNMPLSEEQMLRIPDYVDSYDNILDVVKRKDGSVRVYLGKKINGHAVVVELVSKGRRSLQPVTAWQNTTEHYLKKYREAQKNTDDTTSQAHTSNGQDSGYKPSVFNPIIQQSPAENKGNLPLNKENSSEQDPYSVGAAPGGFDPYSRMLNEYGAIPEGERPARMSDVPRSTDGEDFVRKGARTIMEAGLTSDESARQMEKDIIAGVFSDKKKTLAETVDRAYRYIGARGLDDAFARWDDVVQERVKASEDDIALGIVLWANAERTGDTMTATRLAAEIAAEGTRAGRMVNANRLLKRATPEGRVFYMRKSVAKLQEELAQRLGRRAPDLKLNEDLLTEYINVRSEEESTKILDKIYDDVAEQIPPTVGDRVNAWRYFAMLGNPRTHIRNVVGNILFGELERASGKLSALMQASLPQEQRTRTVMATPEAKEFAKQDYFAMKDVLLGDKYTDELDAIRRRVQSRALGPFSFLSKGNSWLLNFEDLQAKKFVYRRSLAEFITAKGWDPTNLTMAQLETARSHAVHDAEVATFQEENAAAKAISRLERTNKATKVLVGGTMPFKGVPFNIAKEGAIYSPFNAVKSGFDLAKALKTLDNIPAGKKTAAEAIDGIAKGLTGSAVMALGILLAAKGMLSGGGPDDEELDAVGAAQGSQEYALKIKGHTYTLDWAAPSVLPLFLGAEAYNIYQENWNSSEVAEGQEDGEGEELDTPSAVIHFFKTVLDSATRFYEPMINMTMLSGVSDSIKSAAYNKSDPLTGVILGAAQNYAGQFIPTALGQVARTIDDTRRTTFVDKNNEMDPTWQRFIQRQENKIPGLSKKNMPYLDVWGRESKQENLLLRAIENFVSPGYVKKVEDSETTDELKRLHEAGYDDVLPNKPRAYGKINGEYMTQEQYEDRAKTQGKTALDFLTDAVKSSEYQAMSDADKAAYVKKILNYSKEKGKEAAGAETVTSWVSKLDQAAEDSGIGVKSLLRASMQIETTADEDGNGSIKTEEAWNAIQGMDTTEDKKKALFGLYNGTQKSYEEYGEAAAKAAKKREKRDQALSGMDTVKVDAFDAAVSDYGKNSYHDIYTALMSIDATDDEREQYYNMVNGQRSKPWKKSWQEAKKHVQNG